MDSMRPALGQATQPVDAVSGIGPARLEQLKPLVEL
jgi:hypothetical protein